MCAILIVEDDKGIRNNLMNFFCSEGFGVLTAENGYAGYNLAVLNHPDIILSDVHMPVMDGFELIKKLKGNPETSFIPLVLLTSDKEVTQTQDGELILYKPVILSELLNHVNSKLNYSKLNKRQML